MVVGLIGQWDHDNFGDELIAILSILMLQEISIRPVLYRASRVFSNRIEKSLGRRVDGIGSEADFAEHCNAFIFCPGGYMGCSDLTDFRWKGNWREQQWSNLARRIRELGKKYIVLGPEIGPRLPRWILKEVGSILSGAERAFVRNEGAREYAEKKLGVNPEVLPDLVLAAPAFFPKTDQSFIPAAIHITGKFFSENVLASYNRRALFQWATEAKLQSLFLVADQPIKARFRNAIAEFAAAVGRSGCEVTVLDFSSVAELVSTLSRVNLIITTKLHVGVTCLAYGGVVVNFSTHPKVARFSREISTPRFIYANYFLTRVAQKLALLRDAGTIEVQRGDATVAYDVRVRYSSLIKAISI